MSPLNEFSWVVLTAGFLAAAIGMLHAMAGMLRSDKQLHILRVRVQQLRHERVSRLRELQTEEDGGFEIVDDEIPAESRQAA